MSLVLDMHVALLCSVLCVCVYCVVIDSIGIGLKSCTQAANVDTVSWIIAIMMIVAKMKMTTSMRDFNPDPMGVVEIIIAMRVEEVGAELRVHLDRFDKVIDCDVFLIKSDIRS